MRNIFNIILPHSIYTNIISDFINSIINTILGIFNNTVTSTVDSICNLELIIIIGLIFGIYIIWKVIK